MLETWEEAEHQKRCKTNSENASSNPYGLGTHRHTSGARDHLRIAYDMEQDTGQKPAATAVVLKMHTNKTGPALTKEHMLLLLLLRLWRLSDHSPPLSLREQFPHSPNMTSLPHTAYIETATNTKDRIYGLGSIQYPSCHPDETAAASILRQSSEAEEKEQMKNCVNELKTGMELFLKLNGYDPVTYQPVACESTASAPSPRSEQVSSLT